MQRRGALRVTCAYRTVSEAAALIIARVTPIDLLAFEGAKIYNAKTNDDYSKEAKVEIKTEMLREWQDRCTTGEKADGRHA